MSLVQNDCGMFQDTDLEKKNVSTTTKVQTAKANIDK